MSILQRFRRALTRYESALAYALLGIIGGVASALIVIAFELAVVELAALWYVGDSGEDFESLEQWYRFGMPVVGAVLLGLVYTLLRNDDRETGLVHVVQRLNASYGRLPFRNAALQFVGGAFALASGQSGGREGPGVHLGSAVNSLLGQWLQLPNNSLRVLVACGTAGSIAAAFNTPLAGVIFAMEVIVAEYTVAGFLPVMLASVSASAVSRFLGGGSSVFDISSPTVTSLLEIPYIVLLGVCCGAAITVFVRLSALASRTSQWPVLLRFVLAGLVTGGLALVSPQIMGVGYDTLELALYGELAVSTLLIIAGCKILATALSAGVGMPIGLIGPTLLMGACIGAALGILGSPVFPDIAVDVTLYTTIGMAAAMGAAFAAPLAASLAIIELTQSTEVAVPALLAIIAAHLAHSGIFRQRAVHRAMLREVRRNVPDDNPLTLLLHRTDVSSIMEPSVLRSPVLVTGSTRDLLREKAPRWCVVSREGEDLFMVSGEELLAWLKETKPESEEDLLDMTESELRRYTIISVPEQATLAQALDTLKENTAEAVCVLGQPVHGRRHLLGVLTRGMIEQFAVSRL
jgi:CIC family chloride channel protein